MTSERHAKLLNSSGNGLNLRCPIIDEYFQPLTDDTQKCWDKESNGDLPNSARSNIGRYRLVADLEW
jgi:hypothetical protein